MQHQPTKSELRHIMLEKRLNISPDEQKERSEKWCEKTYQKLSDMSFCSFAGYASIQNEIDITPLLHQLQREGKRIALPCITAGSRILTFRHYETPSTLTKGHYNIAEPPKSAEEIPQPEVIIIPLLGFDSQNHRLGYGGGYYDATLNALRTSYNPFTIGCAYDFQQLDYLPTETNDQSLDLIISA